ncbi:hypothetical protein HQ524_01215 [Candidatus Uhrbacteria bacterium]|nr:hypothetical protein [Candidatus Uhrbacteria bacterium]
MFNEGKSAPGQEFKAPSSEVVAPESAEYNMEAVEVGAVVSGADSLAKVMGELADDNLYWPRVELAEVVREAPKASLAAKVKRAAAKVVLVAALMTPFGTAAAADTKAVGVGVEEVEDGPSEKIKGYADSQLEIIKAASESVVYNEAKSIIETLLSSDESEERIFDGINATIKEVMDRITPDVAEVEAEIKEDREATSTMLTEYRLAEGDEARQSAALEAIGRSVASDQAESSLIVVRDSWTVDGTKTVQRYELLLDSEDGENFTITDSDTGLTATFTR